MRRNLRMLRTWTTVLFLGCTLVAVGQTRKKQQDYVPDEKTAMRIAEAVLVARYGEETVNAQRPLRADGSNRDYWIVQLVGPRPAASTGGGPAVWINRHSGCLKIMDHMK
jgi:NTF2 fold immunity protein